MKIPALGYGADGGDFLTEPVCTQKARVEFGGCGSKNVGATGYAEDF